MKEEKFGTDDDEDVDDLEKPSQVLLFLALENMPTSSFDKS